MTMAGNDSHKVGFTILADKEPVDRGRLPSQVGRQNRRSLCTQTVGELRDSHCVQVAWIIDIDTQDMRKFGNHYVGSIQKIIQL